MSKSEKRGHQREALAPHSQSLSSVPIDSRHHFIDGSVFVDPSGTAHSEQSTKHQEQSTKTKDQKPKSSFQVSLTFAIPVL
jgi:hypothetical protein